MKDYRNRITVNPEVHFGKPYIVDTRITVDNVLELIQEGIPFEKIIQNYYPELLSRFKNRRYQGMYSICAGLD